MRPNQLNIMLADDDEDDRLFFREAFEEVRIKTNITTFNNGIELMNYLNTPQTENFKVKEDYIIDTDSNLKFHILLNILQQLGLETKDYELKEHFIDAKLLKCRNAIAHGSILNEQEIEDTYNEIENELLNMILLFQNLIFKAVNNKEYLRDAC